MLEATHPSLVDAARAGDAEAFARLVAPELAAALGAAILVLGSRADAADAMQEALLSAWRGLGGLRDPAAFGAWFRRHAIRSAYRMARTRRALGSLDEAATQSGADLERAIEYRRLNRAFVRLSPADRVVLTLHYHWGQAVSETAATLGIPSGTVKSRVHHALRRLRAAYDAEERT